MTETKTTDEITMEQKGICYRFKPIYEFEKKAVTGAEVVFKVTQKQGANRDMISLLVDAEENGWLSLIDLWCFRNACEVLKCTDLIKKMYVHVTPDTYLNVSAIRKVEDLLKQYGVGTERFCLNLQEGSKRPDGSTLADPMQYLKEQGFSFWGEDFRQSTIHALKRDPDGEQNIQTIWLNRIISQNVVGTQLGGEALKVMLETYRKQQMKVIADGVKTAAQAEWLKAVGCDGFTGPLLSDPLPAEEFLGRYGGCEKAG